ncbi:MAG: redoxin domain-containing protein [Pirellulaceae bacterium]|nr:redoxin domain-containing protein [Pirellulaceae bacterium]
MAVLAIFVFAVPVQGQLTPIRGTVAAPPLSGAGEWLNTAKPLELKDLRGKFVLLDFWTYCCINCMHILPELKKLERKYGDRLVVIGVHSAKFATEREAENIRQAILRYEIEHPVVNDSQLVLWQRYHVNVWPSLRVIDPEGNWIAYHQGEIAFEQLDRFFQQAIAAYRGKRVLSENRMQFELEAQRERRTALRFPGKVLAEPGGRRLFIADSGYNRIVIADLNGQLLAVIGSGREGSADGTFDQASFKHPQGMALHDDALYIADTENHLIRKADLNERRVATIAGNGKQARVSVRRAGTLPRSTPLASPWDLWVHSGDLYIAMAGAHQIWRMDLEGGAVGPFAGNAVEDIVDGPRLPKTPGQTGSASFAQPSGLASDGERLFVADSEGSSIRAVPLAGSGLVTTLVGTSGLASRRLFTFGDRDGPASQALLQHPLGVSYYEGTLYVADTYNDKVKRIGTDPPFVVETIGGAAQTLDEPSGVSAADGMLYIADTNQHAIRTIDLKDPSSVGTFRVADLSPPPVWGDSGRETSSLPGSAAE